MNPSRSRRGQWAWLAALTLLGCESTPPLEVGGYRLTIDGSSHPMRGMQLEVEPDGRFVGHRGGDLHQCEDRLTADEQEVLTDALNTADALDHGDLIGQGCADSPRLDLLVEGVAGAARGWSNQFTYAPCREADARVAAMLEVAEAPLIARAAAGTCTGCAPEVVLGCAGYVDGEHVFCAGSTLAVCDADHLSELTDCPYRTYECTDLGFVAAQRLTLVSGVVSRRYRTDKGSWELLFALDIDVDHPGATPFALMVASQHLRLSDANGSLLPAIEHATLRAPALVAGPSHAVHRLVFRWPDVPAEVALARGLQAELRAQPSDLVSEFGAPVALAVAPWPPPDFEAAP